MRWMPYHEIFISLWDDRLLIRHFASLDKTANVSSKDDRLILRWMPYHEIFISIWDFFRLLMRRKMTHNETIISWWDKYLNMSNLSPDETFTVSWSGENSLNLRCMHDNLCVAIAFFNFFFLIFAEYFKNFKGERSYETRFFHDRVERYMIGNKIFILFRSRKFIF